MQQTYLVQWIKLMRDTTYPFLPSIRFPTHRNTNYFSDWDPQLECIYDCDPNGQAAPWEIVRRSDIDHEQWYLDYYSHLTELLLSKTEAFPELRSIRIETGSHFRDPPDNGITQLAEGLGVELDFGVFENVDGLCRDKW